MVLQCVATFSNFVIITKTECSFLSQQIAMPVRKRDGFLSPNRISELVWDSDSEEAGPSSDCIIYLGKGILWIFRQVIKYLCFRYSSFNWQRKYYVETLDSSSWKIYLKWWRKGKERKENIVSEILRKYGVRVKWDDISDTTTPRRNSTHLHAEISCEYIRPETET